jgi:regulator of cell morphogenesis and NO signaling
MDKEKFHLSIPVKMMEHEHEEAGELMKSIHKLTSNYTPPTYACPTFKMTYLMLQQFETDLRQHIHIENNILFPKVKEGVQI